MQTYQDYIRLAIDTNQRVFFGDSSTIDVRQEGIDIRQGIKKGGTEFLVLSFRLLDIIY